MAKAARPTGLLVPAIGSTSAVDDIASAIPSATALPGAVPATHSPPPISSADASSSAAPIPNTILRIEISRLTLSSSPIANSSSTMPRSANGLIPSGVGDAERLQPRPIVRHRAQRERADDHPDQDEADHRADADAGEGGDDDPGRAEDRQRVGKAGADLHRFRHDPTLAAAVWSVIPAKAGTQSGKRTGFPRSRE